MVADKRMLVSPLPKRKPGVAEDKTLWEYIQTRVAEIVAKHGDKTMMIDGATHEKMSFTEFLIRTKKTAQVLKEKYGVTKGSTVIVCSKNSLNFFVPIQAAVALGALVFAIPAYSSDCVPRCLDEEEHVPVIVCDDGLLAEMEKNIEDASSKRPSSEKPRTRVILLEGQKAGYETIREIIASNNTGEIEFPTLDPHESCLAFMSSGSTGPPKPITHSHYNVLSLSYNNDGFMTEDEESDVRLFHVNHGHIGGLFLFMSMISSGATAISFTNYKQDMMLPTIHKYRVNYMVMYPNDAMYLAKVDDWSMYDLSCVTKFCAGASMLPPSTVRAMRKMFPNLSRPIGQIYGSTEMLLAITSNSLMCPETEAGIGVLNPYTKCKVVSLEDNRALGPNERGEFWIHTPFLMKNYRNRPDLTENAVTPDGWYKTGDYGYYDNNQHLHIVDRVKDLIHLSSGEILSPSEIEDVILQHDWVFQVGVTGVKTGNDLSTKPRAFVVLKKDAPEVKTEDIINFVQNRAKNVLLHITGGAEFVDSLVTSPAGKIYRIKLREDFSNRQQMRV